MKLVIYQNKKLVSYIIGKKINFIPATRIRKRAFWAFL